jgi:hypothetical protein
MLKAADTFQKKRKSAITSAKTSIAAVHSKRMRHWQ